MKTLLGFDTRNKRGSASMTLAFLVIIAITASMYSPLANAQMDMPTTNVKVRIKVFLEGSLIGGSISEPPDISIEMWESGDVDTDDMVHEGRRITLFADIIGGDGNYRYEWTQTQGKSLTLSSSDTALSRFTVPADYITSTISTSTDIVIQLTLRYGSGFNLASMLDKTITVIKVDNETPRLDSELTVNGLALSFDDTRITDSDGNGTLAYQWQRRDINTDSWMDIDFATTAGYTVPQTDSDDSLYRLRVTYTDAQGYGGTKNVTAIGFRKDVDVDDNRLVEIYYLEHLNAIRYALDGSGYKANAEATNNITGCPVDGCNGFELMRDLDYKDDNSYHTAINKATWTTGAGWQPIGDSSDAFNVGFYGNGYTISNLFINSSETSVIGLFGYTGSEAEIVNLGLPNIDITASTSYVGGLAGRNSGTVTNSHATGFISGTSSRVGGLLGRNVGTVTGSYAMVSVSGTSRIGGLVGRNAGTVMDSYAMGSVMGSERLGGLVGHHDTGTITNSYATGVVIGDRNIGGLIGRHNTGTIANSYWDINTSGITTGVDGIGKTKIELQSPTAPGSTANEVYHSWSTNDWDFGTSIQYPVLKYAGSDILLSDQGVGLRDLEVVDTQCEIEPNFQSINHSLCDRFPC